MALLLHLTLAKEIDKNGVEIVKTACCVQLALFVISIIINICSEIKIKQIRHDRLNMKRYINKEEYYYYIKEDLEKADEKLLHFLYAIKERNKIELYTVHDFYSSKDWGKKIDSEIRSLFSEIQITMNDIDESLSGHTFSYGKNPLKEKIYFC